MRYANNSNYKNDTMIRKEAVVNQAVLEELKRIITDSEVRAASLFVEKITSMQRACRPSNNSLCHADHEGGRPELAAAGSCRPARAGGHLGEGSHFLHNHKAGIAAASTAE